MLAAKLKKLEAEIDKLKLAAEGLIPEDLVLDFKEMADKFGRVTQCLRIGDISQCPQRTILSYKSFFVTQFVAVYCDNLPWFQKRKAAGIGA